MSKSLCHLFFYGGSLTIYQLTHKEGWSYLIYGDGFDLDLILADMGAIYDKVLDMGKSLLLNHFYYKGCILMLFSSSIRHIINIYISI